ncbi:MAG: lipocalin family protein [Tessaracoccus sp.]|uniref:lipocalin family protein n=1 Tax=Tessaracoccus sp. TaxID=1971211 RepID=UPI001EB4B70F|nr:lipocalin family protein [Tessaracoccus sp.]MBK7822890.1 lipocalin family protein [Tessaracoccus sp.]
MLGPQPTTEVTSVSHLDLQRYLGLWFEIGRLPLRFEDEDARDVTATYTLNDDGTVRVDNRCIDGEGKPTQAVGQAIADDDHPAQLQVTFLPAGLRWIPGTKANYWVLKIDDDYRHALIGTPDRKHLWLLARETRVDAATETRYLAEAVRQGFVVSSWIRPVQTGQRVTDELLGR